MYLLLLVWWWFLRPVGHKSKIYKRNTKSLKTVSALCKKTMLYLLTLLVLFIILVFVKLQPFHCHMEQLTLPSCLDCSEVYVALQLYTAIQFGEAVNTMSTFQAHSWFSLFRGLRGLKVFTLQINGLQWLYFAVSGLPSWPGTNWSFNSPLQRANNTLKRHTEPESSNHVSLHCHHRATREKYSPQDLVCRVGGQAGQFSPKKKDLSIICH